MAHSRTLFGGMDVPKASSAVAHVAQDHGAEVMDLGAIGTRQGDIDPRIRTMPSQATHLIVISDAGPGGSGLSRSLPKKGDDGWVVAPALIPKKAGDRVQTDRRDAVPRARVARSGDLTAVDVPTVDDEAMRARTRARADALRDRTDAKVRLHALLLRQDSRSVGRATWRPAHLRWRSEVGGPPPAQHLVVQEDVRAVHEQTERLQRLEQERHEPVTPGRLHPGVEALQALRGVPCTVAVTLVADMGDRTRVDPPRALMKCLGLMPAASSSGAPRRQGAITNAGHPQARRALVEGAWA